MKATIKEISPTVRELELEIPAEMVTESFDAKVNKYRKQIDLKGFRKGKLPKKIVVARFGASIRAEAVEETVDKAIREELDKANIEPVNQGNIEKFDDKKEEGIFLTVQVEVDPKIEISNYTASPQKIEEVSIPEDQIEAELKRAAESAAVPETVDRPAQVGDLVRGEYIYLELGGELKALPDDKTFQARVGDDEKSVFDKYLVGVSAGEEKEFSHQYPEDHADKTFAGKEAKTKVKILEVHSMQIPELNDELAVKFGATDLADLKAKIEDSLKSQKKDAQLNQLREDAIDKILEANPFDVPEARVRHYVETVKHQNEHQQNPNAEEHQRAPVSDEEVEEMREEAVRALRRYRVIQFVAEKEKIKVKQADVDTYVKKMAESMGYPFEELKKSLRQSGRIVEIREDLKMEKTLNFIAGIEPEVESKGE